LLWFWCFFYVTIKDALAGKHYTLAQASCRALPCHVPHLAALAERRLAQQQLRLAHIKVTPLPHLQTQQQGLVTG
jgi:hypothetical protein